MRWHPKGYGGERRPVDDVKRDGWREQGLLVVSVEDDRLTWPERELVRQLGEKLLSYDFCRLPRQQGATARHAIWRAVAGVGSREAGPPLAPCRSGIAPVFIFCPERIPGFTARMTRRGSG